MMTSSARVMRCCVALFLVLTSVSAAQKKLDSINDLKKINFDQSVPKHSLLLLHWFANKININNNDVIQLAFDPNDGDYGSHHYGNFEGMLDPLPQGNAYRYYTIGNLNQGTSIPLPAYVVRPPREYVGRNRDRIIIRVREQNTGGRAHQRIDQVYITQHYDTSENLGTPYDPDHTYRITTNLLRQVREFAVEENQQPLLNLRNRFGSNADESDIRNTWGQLACLGLLLYIVIQEKYSSSQPNNRPDNRRSQRESNVPRRFPNQGDVVVDFTNYDNNCDHYDDHYFHHRTTGNRESGRGNTSVPQDNNQMSCCCICCISFASICMVSLLIFLIVWFIPKIIA
ncbi:uncharacterized protein LOC115011981 [Cottoperca gobio]|uniref:Uncharacterized protein LOC115011981 n=1 Tax=Cottoperca gobio TaxID=56716 RepID=A0A6J2Q699_COTGO|nr:uncharacterized protein LOC115011981 [Cottoperca gobio]